MKKYLLSLIITSQAGFAWNFTEKSVDVGLSYNHSYDGSIVIREPHMIAGGLAIGDINGDGWDDIFAVTGENLDQNDVNTNQNKLFISQQDGTYLEQASQFGLSQNDVSSAGPLIVDFNNDGYRDLLIGSIASSPQINTYLNQQNSGFTSSPNSFFNSKHFWLVSWRSR